MVTADPVVTAGPRRAAAGALLVGAVVLVALGLASDAPGRLLALPAALVLAGLAARDLLLQPVLRADESELELVVGLRRRRVPWPDVEGVRVVRDRRTPLLEIDLGDTLVVLTRLRLGRAPQEVLADLQALERRGWGPGELSP